VLPTFTRNLSAEEKAALDKANTLLANGGADPAGARFGQTTVNASGAIKPGQTTTILKWTASGPSPPSRSSWTSQALAKTRRFHADLVLQIQRDILRDLVLRITWDGEDSPSVFSPWGISSVQRRV